jgi:hypothetical protein
MKEKTSILPEFADYPIYRGSREVVNNNESGYLLNKELAPPFGVKPIVPRLNETAEEGITSISSSHS